MFFSKFVLWDLTSRTSKLCFLLKKKFNDVLWKECGSANKRIFFFLLSNFSKMLDIRDPKTQPKKHWIFFQNKTSVLQTQHSKVFGKRMNFFCSKNTEGLNLRHPPWTQSFCYFLSVFFQSTLRSWILSIELWNCVTRKPSIVLKLYAQDSAT